MSTVPAISWHDVRVELGGATVLDGLTLDIAPGTWLSLIGPNGAGKTTLVRTLSGGITGGCGTTAMVCARSSRSTP